MAKQTEIGYEAPTEYKPYQTGGTLIRASELNAMNGGIADACAGVDELRTKRLPTYVVAQDGDTATQDVYAEPILGPCLILDLATRTTYYETGGDEDGHRKAITSGDDIDALRDSLSQYTGVLDRFGMSESVTRFAVTYDSEISSAVLSIHHANGKRYNFVLSDSGSLSGSVSA